METFKVKIVGGSHHKMRQAFEEQKLFVGCALELVPEPNNPYDSNAIKALVGGMQIGYVEKGKSGHVSRLINESDISSAHISKIPNMPKLIMCFADLVLKERDHESLDAPPPPADLHRNVPDVEIKPDQWPRKEPGNESDG